MPNLTQLRLAAREIFDATLNAVDAAAAVHRNVRRDGLQLLVSDTQLNLVNRKAYAIAIGKAARPMAYALEQVLGDSFTEGLVSGPSVPSSSQKLNSRWRKFEGGHPLPNQTSLAAASEGFGLLKRANEERALLIFLISGGGSAMLEWPINNDITLEDLRTANKVLVKCGASITEVNSVRCRFSAVKGGRLAMRAPDCDQVTLIVSDVPKGEERNVASGPTLAPPDNATQALDVLNHYDLRAHLSESILRAVETDSGSPRNDLTSLRRHFVLLDNESALEAAAEAARRRGFTTEMAPDISDQPIEEGCKQLVDRLNKLREKAGREQSSGTNSVCLISGGEFACPVSGEGLGGRNMETALRLATGATLSNSAHLVALCAGTDGIDGNSPAAGAIVDQTTDARARAIGLEPTSFLDRSDAYSFFVALGDAIATGATGTNVRDLRILLATCE